MGKNTSKRIDGATPNGGDYAVAYFRDENKQPCSEGKAAYIEIVEYTKDGNEIHRTHATANNGAGKHG